MRFPGTYFMKNKKGLSLLESIITIAIFSFLLTVCSLILNRALIISSHGKASSVVGNEAMKSISWLISDMSESTAASLAILDSSSNRIFNPYPPSSAPSSDTLDVSYISFLTGLDGSMNIEYTDTFPPLIKWKYYVLYSMRPSNGDMNILYRKLYDGSSSSAYDNTFKKYFPMPMTPGDIVTQSLAPGSGEFKERVVAKNIYNLELVSLCGNICTLKVTAGEDGRNGISVKSCKTITVVMKNTVKSK